MDIDADIQLAQVRLSGERRTPDFFERYFDNPYNIPDAWIQAGDCSYAGCVLVKAGVLLEISQTG